ncbi:MAG: hypothetical protein ACI35O_17080, partial [Bacillaceae bacterium]
NNGLAKRSMFIFNVYVIIQILSILPVAFVSLFMNESSLNFTLGAGVFLFAIIVLMILIYFAYLLLSMLNDANKSFS